MTLDDLRAMNKTMVSSSVVASVIGSKPDVVKAQALRGDLPWNVTVMEGRTGKMIVKHSREQLLDYLGRRREK